MMNIEAAGKLIRGLRKEKGWTQKELATVLHVTDKAVSKWETGKAMPDFALMPDVCEVLGISVSELLSGEKGYADMELKDNVRLIMEVIDREKAEKAKKLNGYFGLGFLFLIFVLLYGCFWNSLDLFVAASAFVLGIAFEMTGFYYNCKNGKRRTFTERELDVLTGNEKTVRMKTAAEMLQFARKYQKAEFKQYKLAFEEIAEHMEEDEYAMFTMVGDSYTVNDNPGPWYAALAVTDSRVLIAGETVRGQMMTRFVSDIYERSEIVSIEFINRKIVLHTTLKHCVKIEGENLELIAERLRESLGK